MRYVFKSLFAKKWFVIFTIIQMAVGFILLNNALLIGKSIINRNGILTSLIGNIGNTNMVHLSNYSSGETRKTDELKGKLLELIDYIKNSKDIEKVGSFKNDSILIAQDDIYNPPKDMEVELLDENKVMVKYISLPAIFIDDGMYNMVNINISKGRGFNKDDYDLDVAAEIPVIIGENLSKYYNIGDVIVEKTDAPSRYLTKYKVVGILNKGQMFFAGDSNFSSIKNMENALLIPFSKEDNSLDDYFIRYGVNCSYRVKGDADVTQVMNDFDKKSSDLNLTLKSIKYSDDMKEINGVSNGGIFYNAFLAFMLTFFSLLGIVSSILLSVLKNRREYGIRMAIGAKPNDISRGIVIEIIAMFIIAIIIVNLLMIIFPQVLAVQITQKSDYIIFILSSSLVFLIGLIISIIPIKIMKKLDVNDLLRRKE
ncbi:MAG: ABC transporter permease [Oscillospiraceae bacterium]|nr:ABC transporter permease [Oscillospiraceae bacterium]